MAVLDWTDQTPEKVNAEMDPRSTVICATKST